VDFLHCAGSGEQVDDTMTYRYREEKGFIASVVIDNSTFTGRQLRALYEREFRIWIPCARQNALPELPSSRILAASP
jgi:recombinational DNA repair protein (RecF pathway)